jgi:predicted amidophosphoribosyltransferase
MADVYTPHKQPVIGHDEAQRRADLQADYEAGRASLPMSPPERCGGCGASLVEIGPVGVLCPHCGADLEDLAKRGIVWKD